MSCLWDIWHARSHYIRSCKVESSGIPFVTYCLKLHTFLSILQSQAPSTVISSIEKVIWNSRYSEVTRTTWTWSCSLGCVEKSIPSSLQRTLPARARSTTNNIRSLSMTEGITRHHQSFAWMIKCCWRTARMTIEKQANWTSSGLVRTPAISECLGKCHFIPMNDAGLCCKQAIHSSHLKKLNTITTFL